ncbi:MAG: hypothetical protein J5818_00430 [Eggerthellaceae bacterium]|nr:hypothetical protein [Eggerthellaceae bacterium]
MGIESGNEYVCALVVHMGLLGKRDVEAVIDVDTPTSFHGYGRLVGKPITIAGMTVDENSRMYFNDGVIDGDSFAFTVSGGGITATFNAQVAEDGSITGKANAGGVLSIKITGAIKSVSPLA